MMAGAILEKSLGGARAHRDHTPCISRTRRSRLLCYACTLGCEVLWEDPRLLTSSIVKTKWHKIKHSCENSAFSNAYACSGILIRRRGLTSAFAARANARIHFALESTRLSSERGGCSSPLSSPLDTPLLSLAFWKLFRALSLAFWELFSALSLAFWELFSALSLAFWELFSALSLAFWKLFSALHLMSHSMAFHKKH